MNAYKYQVIKGISEWHTLNDKKTGLSLLSTNDIRRLLFKYRSVAQSTVTLSNNTVEINYCKQLQEIVLALE